MAGGDGDFDCRREIDDEAYEYSEELNRLVQLAGEAIGTDVSLRNSACVEVVIDQYIQGRKSFAGLKQNHDKIRRRLTAHAKIAKKAETYASLLREAKNYISWTELEPGMPGYEWRERVNEALRAEPHVSGKVTKR